MESSKQQTYLLLLISCLFMGASSAGTNEKADAESSQALRDQDAFSIYLVRSPFDLTEDAKKPLAEISLEAKPFLASGDIVQYDADTHTILLTEQAFRRVLALEVPVWGRAFVVTVNKKRIYLAGFWEWDSSFSYSGVVIVKPRTGKEERVIRIELGYPSQAEFEGRDPRGAEEVFQSMKNLRKLRPKHLSSPWP